MRGRDLYTLRRMQTLGLSSTYTLRTFRVKLGFVRGQAQPQSQDRAPPIWEALKIAKSLQSRETVTVRLPECGIRDVECRTLNDLCKRTSTSAKL